MIVVTTPTIEGQPIVTYIGIVGGEAIMGTSVFRDFIGGIRELVSGRAGTYESELQKARELAISEMVAQAESLGADAVVGADLDYQHLAGEGKSMLMVCANGTAVRLK